MTFPTAFNPSAFTTAFQIAETYAAKRRRRGRGGSKAFLVPYRPIYDNERYVILRTRIAQAQKWTENHYAYTHHDLEENIKARQLIASVAAVWINTNTPATEKEEPFKVTAKAIEYDETESH